MFDLVLYNQLKQSIILPVDGNGKCSNQLDQDEKSCQGSPEVESYCVGGNNDPDPQLIEFDKRIDNVKSILMEIFTKFEYS